MNKLPPLPKPVYLAVKDFDDYICGHPSDQMIVYGQQCRDAALDEAADR